MTIEARTTVKSYFETGDKPTQAQFTNFIDSAIFYEDTSDFGRSLVSASAAASARGLLGSGITGDKIFTAITTASAQNHLGGGALGKFLFETITTASGQTQLGCGIAGRSIFEAITTASVVSQLSLNAIPTTAAQSDQEAGTSGSVYVSPSAQQYHPSAAKAWVYFKGTSTVTNNASYNVSSITDNGTGDYTVNFITAFSSTNYCALTNSRNIAGAGNLALITTRGTSGFRFTTTDAAGAAADFSNVDAIFLGDQ